MVTRTFPKNLQQFFFIYVKQVRFCIDCKVFFINVMQINLKDHMFCLKGVSVSEARYFVWHIFYCKSLNIGKCLNFAVFHEWCASRIQNLVNKKCRIHVRMSICALYEFLYSKLNKKKSEIQTVQIISCFVVHMSVCQECVRNLKGMCASQASCFVGQTCLLVRLYVLLDMNDSEARCFVRQTCLWD